MASLENRSVSMEVVEQSEHFIAIRLVAERGLTHGRRLDKR
jgi:hypothetical protein